MKTKLSAVALGALLSSLALASSALAATTVTLTVGPVPTPAVPVEVCVDTNGVEECVSGPPAQTVSLTVAVSADANLVPVLVPPTIMPGTCPTGTQGVALVVNTGSVGAVITGFATVTVNGIAQTVPIDQVVATPNRPVTIFACAGVG